jgi:hypothetical protein
MLGKNLGKRPGKAAFKALCEDCGFWYIWEEGKTLPRASKPKKLKEGCGCPLHRDEEA